MNTTQNSATDMQRLIEITPWDQIIECILSDQFVEAFAHIPIETIEFTSDDQNRETIVQSVLKSMQQKNPEITREMAEEVASKLIDYAKLQTGESV